MRNNGKVGDVRYGKQIACPHCDKSHERIKFTRCEPYLSHYIEIYWWGLCPVSFHIIDRAVVRVDEREENI